MALTSAVAAWQLSKAILLIALAIDSKDFNVSEHSSQAALSAKSNATPAALLKVASKNCTILSASKN